MIPQVIHYDGNTTSEVFGFNMTELTDKYVTGIAVVTVPGSGRFATVRAMSNDGIEWLAVPHTFATGYSGLRDAMRHGYQRSGLDNISPTVPMAAVNTSHPSYG